MLRLVFIFQVYIGIPNKPDKSSTDKIRFKCKSTCIDNCFPNNKNKSIKFYDGREEEEWHKDDTIKATCQDGNNNTGRTSVQNIDNVKQGIMFANNQIQKSLYHFYIG